MSGRHRMKATQAAIARPSATESEKERQRDVIGGKREKKSVVNQPKKYSRHLKPHLKICECQFA